MIQLSNQKIFIILIIVLLLSLFLVYTFYTDTESLKQVYAKVEGIQDIDAKFTSATITFNLNITNPSSKSINQLSSTFDIFIENNFIGTGSFADYSIPAKTSIDKEVEVNVNYGGLADSSIDILKNWASGEESEIKIDGTITASILFGLTAASQDFTARS